jgi:hypothetical protein
MSKFKVGDRLKQVKGGNVPELKGQIIEINTTEGTYYYCNNGTYTEDYLEDNFKPITSPQYQPIIPKVGEKYRVVKDIHHGRYEKGEIVSFNDVSQDKYGYIKDSNGFSIRGTTDYLTTEYLELVEEPETEHFVMGDCLRKIAEHSAYRYMGFEGTTGMETYQPEPINQSIITKSMNFIKNALLSKEDKTLIKAGFLNEDLSLTSQGKQALEFITFKASKKELVTMAEEQIAEEKE